MMESGDDEVAVVQRTGEWTDVDVDRGGLCSRCVAAALHDQTKTKHTMDAFTT